MSAATASRSGRNWLPEEDDRLREMMKSGFTREWMGQCLGRTAYEVSLRMSRLGLIPRAVGEKNYDWKAEIPEWVPARLHEEFDAVAFEDGNEAAVRWARKELGIDKPVPPVVVRRSTDKIVSPTARTALQRVCWLHDVRQEEVFGRSRHYQIALARHHFIWLLRRHTKLSCPQIGRILGRDHSTIVHSTQRFRAKLAERRVKP